MSAAGRASPRRATLDAVALAVAFLAVEAVLVAGVIAGLVDGSQATVAILALGAVVLLLYRDDVMNAIAAGNEKLGLHADEGVRAALDALAGDGWSVRHDVGGGGGRIDHVVNGPNGAFVILVRQRAYRVEHLGRARHHAARMRGEAGRWVTPVVCLTMRDDTPHRRDGVWILGAEHLVGWLESRTDGPPGRAA